MGEFDGGADAGVPRLEVLREAILADAQRLGVAVGLSALCRSAAARLDVVAVAVSVPSVTATVINIDTLAAFGPLARWGEELQFTVGQGPSMEALSRSGPLLVEDLGDPGQQARWPLFAPAAFEAGIVSLCMVPMRIGAARFGVFVAYLDRTGSLSPAGLGDAVLFASLALELLLDHLDATAPDYTGEPGSGGLHEPRAGGAGLDSRTAGGGAGGRGWDLDDRPAIHQATGMVSEQLHVDMATALLRLRARAFSDDRMLSELAADVVARLVRLDEDPATEPEERPR